MASRSLAHLLFIGEIFLVFLQLHIYLESIDVATGVLHRRPTQPNVGAMGDATARISVPHQNFFFFFHFWICADSRRLGPICANLDRIGLYQPAKNDRFRSIPALNQAEIQVKIIIFLKKVQKHL